MDDAESGRRRGQENIALQRQVAQPSQLLVIELLPCPFDGLRRLQVEADQLPSAAGVGVVIAHDHRKQIKLADYFQTFTRTRVVSDYVTNANVILTA